MGIIGQQGFSGYASAFRRPPTGSMRSPKQKLRNRVEDAGEIDGGSAALATANVVGPSLGLAGPKIGQLLRVQAHGQLRPQQFIGPVARQQQSHQPAPHGAVGGTPRFRFDAEQNQLRRAARSAATAAMR